MRTRTAVLGAFTFLLAFAAAPAADAQTVIVQGQPQPGQQVMVQPGYAPGPVYAPGYAPPPGPGYTTPIYQQTQPSYVPQSVAFSGPRVITDWSEGEPIPAGYHESTRVRKGLVIGGAVTFGSMYLITALSASILVSANNDCVGCSNGSWGTLFIPAVGPFVAMGNSGNGAVGNFWLAFDGVVQVAGLTMLTIGLAAPKTVLVRNDLGSNSDKGGLKLALAPIIAPNRQGAGLVGTF
jgi:hypothetical protein